MRPALTGVNAGKSRMGTICWPCPQFFDVRGWIAVLATSRVRRVARACAVRRTGRSVRLVRTTIEVVVVLAGVALGGTLGVATVVYALTIGPLVQALLPPFVVAPASGNTDGTPELHTATRPLT